MGEEGEILQRLPPPLEDQLQFSPEMGGFEEDERHTDDDEHRLGEEDPQTAGRPPSHGDEGLDIEALQQEFRVNRDPHLTQPAAPGDGRLPQFLLVEGKVPDEPFKGVDQNRHEKEKNAQDKKEDQNEGDRPGNSPLFEPKKDRGENRGDEDREKEDDDRLGRHLQTGDDHHQGTEVEKIE